MDLTLYYRIYGEGMNKWIILRYTGYTKTRHLYNLTENHVWRAQLKVRD